MYQKEFVFYDPTLHHTHFYRDVIFFENQHFFLVSYVPSFSTVVLPSFEQQFSNLPQVSPHFNLGMLYIRRSLPQSLPMAHPISDSNMQHL